MNELLITKERFRWLVDEFNQRVKFSVPWLDSLPSSPCEGFCVERKSDLHSYQLILRKLDYWTTRRPIVFIGMRFALDVIDGFWDFIPYSCGSSDSKGLHSPYQPADTSWNEWRAEFDRCINEYVQERSKIFRLDFNATADLESLYRAFCEGFRSTIEYVYGSMDRDGQFRVREFITEIMAALSHNRGSITQLFMSTPIASPERRAA